LTRNGLCAARAVPQPGRDFTVDSQILVGTLSTVLAAFSRTRSPTRRRKRLMRSECSQSGEFQPASWKWGGLRWTRGRFSPLPKGPHRPEGTSVVTMALLG